MKDLARRWVKKAALCFLGVLLFTFAVYPTTQSLWAQPTHDGKFSVASTSNARSTIYTSGVTGPQTILVTVCVTTAGTQNAAVQHLDAVGAATALGNVKFGTCRSFTDSLALDEAIAVKSITSGVAFTGTYLVSVPLP